MRQGPRTLAAFVFLIVCSGIANAQSPDKQVCAGSDADRAIAACGAILDKGRGVPLPDQVMALINRGNAFARKADYDRAIVDYDAALRIEPGNARARNGRGIAHRHKGDYDLAIAEYDAVLRQNPRDERALNNRGVAWRWKRDYDRSIADLSAAIKVAPKYALAYSNRAVAYRLKLDFSHAIADHDLAVSMAPKAATAYYDRGGTYEARGDYAKALADYRHAGSLTPANEHFAQAVKRVELRLAQAQSPAPKASAPPPPGAQASLPPAPNAAGQEVRVALVIGNGGYVNVAGLSNPKNDATALAAALQKLGFTRVTLKLDQSREKLLDALKGFAAEAERADWAVVYYAGHGVEVSGSNYLIPVDAKLKSDRDVTFETVALDQVLQAVDGARKLRLVILDACRDNPFLKAMSRSLSRTRSISQGLANIEPDGATLVAYAAKHGQLALDGEGGNSPFVTALVKNLPTPGLEINLLFRKVRDEVLNATGRQQEPFTYGSLPSEAFYFRKP